MSTDCTPRFPIPEGRSERVTNWLKAAWFGCPDWIPYSIGLLPATWKEGREAFEDILAAHPKSFPNFQKGQRDFDALPDHPLYRVGRHTDAWGCVWENVHEGMDSVVVEHPLSDWEAFDSYQPPDPYTTADWGPQPDWDELKKRYDQVKAAGGLAVGGVTHGFMYMKLYYLRGFENLMIDIATDDPRLPKLIDMVLDYNLKYLEQYIEAGVEFMFFAGDLGLQDSLPMSPEKWRKYLGPCYKALFGLAKAHGVGTYLHSDGHIIEIIPDLADYGLDIINAQYRANGLEELVRVGKGRLCVHLDLDRQLMPFATPQQLKDHVYECVEAFKAPEGGLMLNCEIGPDVPLENVDALFTALEEVGGPWL